MCIKGRHARTPTVAKLPCSKKKPRSLTLVLDSFVPSARVMDREKMRLDADCSPQVDISILDSSGVLVLARKSFRLTGKNGGSIQMSGHSASVLRFAMVFLRRLKT